MDQAEVEYVSGPADGTREMLPVGPSGEPPRDRIVMSRPLPERWDSIHAPTPAVPAQPHRYVRAMLVAVRGGVALWRYHHEGLLT